MAGRRDRKKARRQFDRVEPVQDAFGIRLRCKLQSMDDTLGGEAGGVFTGIRDVVPVRKEEIADPPESVETPCEMLDESGRIDQPVAIGVTQKVRITAERLARVESAVINVR